MSLPDMLLAILLVQEGTGTPTLDHVLVVQGHRVPRENFDGNDFPQRRLW